MATYTKSLKTVTFTLHDASTVVAADTAEKPIGSTAFDQFIHRATVVVPGEESTTYIPHDAIVKAVVAVSTTEVTKADAYGCEEKQGETVEP